LTTTSTGRAFKRTSKRRRGFPSETHVKRGVRVVHGDKELIEKLGRNDPCPCGSGRRFQEVLPAHGALLTAPIAGTTPVDDLLGRRARARRPSFPFAAREIAWARLTDGWSARTLAAASGSGLIGVFFASSTFLPSGVNDVRSRVSQPG
jgi:hypothetical protein